jgi:hypothetical protein
MSVQGHLRRSRCLANFFSEAISRLRIVIELLFDAAHRRVEEDGRLWFRLLPSENAGETSYAFACTIRVV